MQNGIEAIESNFIEEIQSASDESTLEGIRLKALGKKGSVSELLRTLGSISPEEQKIEGSRINGLKNKITQALTERGLELKAQRREKEFLENALDVTLPVHPLPSMQGKIHPISYVIEEICHIFKNMGFQVAEGPDIETDYYNFTALNFPEDHPAREMHDTFFFKSDGQDKPKLLRTHTSCVQVRTMERQKPPIRIITPGKTYRLDSDATHTPMFHQLEGLVIDESANIANMKWVLQEFCRRFFEVKNLEMRFRPSFFPFTEPSIEVDIRCDRSCNEVRLGQGDHWMEILGCGMVHPNVLANVGIDSEKYQGFAWGVGIDRLAMLKYNIPDLRSFFEADIRWLSHYGFRPFDVLNLS